LLITHSSRFCTLSFTLLVLYAFTAHHRMIDCYPFTLVFHYCSAIPRLSSICLPSCIPKKGSLKAVQSHNTRIPTSRHCDSDTACSPVCTLKASSRNHICIKPAISSSVDHSLLRLLRGRPCTRPGACRATRVPSTVPNIIGGGRGDPRVDERACR
jgi:hypothetical protein